MTLLGAVSYLLQMLEIGQVDERGVIELYHVHDQANGPSLPARLIFRTVERGIRVLTGRQHLTLDQELTDRQLRMLHVTLQRELRRATLSERLGEDYMREIREEALGLLREAIGQHQYLCRLLHERSAQTNR